MENVPKLTKEQCAIISAYTGTMCGSFSDMHDYAEQILNTSIFTHEFGDPELIEKLKIASKADFLKIAT